MRNLIIALLILGLVAPALTAGANHPGERITRYHDAHYAAGGSGFATSVEPSRDLPGEGGIHAVYTGDIIVPLTDPDPEGDYTWVDHVETVNVTFDDFVTPHVAVYYSFHANDDIETSLFGGPHKALETGVFCDEAELDRPLEPILATHLRLSVNTASALDANVCPFGGVATAGTWQAHHPGAIPDPNDERPWSPPIP